MMDEIGLGAYAERLLAIGAAGAGVIYAGQFMIFSLPMKIICR